MILEALEFLRSQFTKAAGVTHEELFDGRQLLIKHDAGYELIDRPPPPRSHTVFRVDDLIAAAVQFSAAGNGVIFLGRRKAVLVCDCEDRRETVTLSWGMSTQYETVVGLGSESFDQRQAVWLWRHTLAGCAPPQFHDVFRQVTFERASNATGRIAHGDESMGRSIEAAIAKTDGVPEAIAVHMPLFTLPDFRDRYEIRITIDIDLQSQRFRFCPLPDACREAEDIALAELRTDIVRRLKEADSEEVSVYVGNC